MMMGPGKYDNLCTAAREQADADGAVVILFNGKHGDGISMQATAELTVALPEILRNLARSIEKELNAALHA
jgi:hypothetical protein